MGIWAAAGTLCILSFDIGAARGKADPPLIESLKPIEGRSRDALGEGFSVWPLLLAVLY